MPSRGVMIGDGGTTPRLYLVDAGARSARLVFSLLPLSGNCFSDFCSYFEPFHFDTSEMDKDTRIRYQLSVAGKAMAYAALGTPRPAAFPVFDGSSPTSPRSRRTTRSRG